MSRINPLAILVLALLTFALGSYYISSAKAPESSSLYGGLVQASESLAQITPQYTLSFPFDHRAHPEFTVEWWYFTSNLRSNSTPVQRYSVQFTLFRFNRGQLTQSPWSDGQLYMAHASIHTPEEHYFSERFASGGLKYAGVSTDPLVIQLEDWSWRSTTEQLLPARLHMPLKGVDLMLSLNAAGPIVLHGERGYSRKSASGSHASMYYSQPFIEVLGNLTTATSEVSLVGHGWFDHEWTSQVLNEQTQGWDWFSLHLDSGEKLMAFRMRLNNQAAHVTGTLIAANGETQSLSPNELSLTPQNYAQHEQRKFPAHWRIEVPSHGVDVELVPLKTDQWNLGRFPYYEGAVTVTGSHSGKGFMELTGY